MEGTHYRPICMRPMKIGAVCRQPSTYNVVQLDTPAIDVMTDFQVVSPALIRPDATLAQAASLMVARSVRFLFVVNDDDAIVGVITARDLNGERASRLTAGEAIKAGALRVEQVMTLRENLEAITLADVMHAEVGHVLETLKQIGRQHAIVIETHHGSGVELVRGIFSATQIGRRLGVPVKTFAADSTFAEIETALAAA